MSKTLSDGIKSACEAASSFIDELDIQDIADANVKERIIQQYLFDHLWLLDPSWERASSSAQMEKRIYKALNASALGLSNDEKAARLDIKYKTIAGKTIVIELKRYNRIVSSHELETQVSKYSKAIRHILSEMHAPKDFFEIICILGNKLENDDDDEKRAVEKLAIDNARYITYDSIIDNTQRIKIILTMEL